MLLLMVDADFNEAREIFALALFRTEEHFERLIDVGAIGKDAFGGGACQQPSSRTRMAWSKRFIVRVKAIIEVFVERLVAIDMRLQNDVLEEPRDVREMPFGGARVFHRLHDHVLGRERCGKRNRMTPRGE